MRIAVLSSCIIFIGLLSGCGCSPYSNCYVVGPAIPKIRTSDDVVAKLRSEVNPPLTWIDRSSGFLTTPFKRAGILGWEDIGLDMTVVGAVINAASSTDGFHTVDVRIKHLAENDRSFPGAVGKFLRSEICVDTIGLTPDRLPLVGDEVRIFGRIKWDGDGFFEIHPRRSGDVERLSTGSSPHS